jgi:hypothetical protein
MKLFILIFGILFACGGLGMTVYSWYAASAQGQIVPGLAYAGPFLLIVGAWRILAAGMASSPRALRIVAVLIGVAAGYGNGAVLKAAFPNDRVIASSSNSNN